MAGTIQGRFKDEVFSRETVKLDGSQFTKCQFKNCTFVYAGGPPPAISGCNFDNCSWQFASEAANTVAFLSGFYNGGFADLIEATFHEIRKGDMIKPTVADQTKEKSRTFFGMAPLKVFRVPKKK